MNRTALIFTSSKLMRTQLATHRKYQTNPQQHGIITFSDGRTLSLRTGKLARMTDGCAIAEMGDTSVMVTAVGKSKAASGATFLPLQVDYRQKSAAAGRIPTNFLRRELGVTEREILTSRLIDRSIRPMFPSGYLCETQIVCNLLAVDGVYDPDILSINAASAALSISDIPWGGPVGAVRVGIASNEVLVNPTRKDLLHSQLNLVVVATSQNLVVMLEGSSENILQQDLLKSIKHGVRECQSVVKGIQNMQKSIGKKKRSLEEASLVIPELIVEAVTTMSQVSLQEIFGNFDLDKLQRDNAVAALRLSVIEKLRENYPSVELNVFNEAFSKVTRNVFRELILNNNARCDGRGLRDLRPISCEVDLHKPLHGSALFQRGQTQVFSTVSFDSLDSVLKSDPLSVITGGLKEKNFFLHYEFPPYATNEIGRAGVIGRRETGHGALSEKSIRPVVPENFPFTIRVTSEVLESNGSSSMASVCSGSLALMDAGVPISSPVAGVAIGLVTSYTGIDSNHLEKYCLLTDILGIEDYMGDMDFKIAGTRKGITALQLDLKIPGLPLKVVMEAILQASDAKSEILSLMQAVISRPRVEKKENWPLSEELVIPAHRRSRFLGYGGRHLKQITAETGIQITQVDETTYNLFSPNPTAMVEAKEMIQKYLTEDREPQLEFGGIYLAKVVEVRESGVMVILHPEMQPVLLHNSQLDQRRVMHPSALGLQVGQEFSVKYFGRDPISGCIRLSRKVLQGPFVAEAKTLT